MTSLIEKIVAFVAPHHCLVCGIEDNVLCAGCRLTQLIQPDPVCVLCGRPSLDWRLCPACQRQSGLDYVWIGGDYSGPLAELLRRFKFERSRAAYEPLSQLLADRLPYGNWQLVPIPTAPSRIRQRGYDQTLLLAEALAATRELPLAPLLRRWHDDRQVGASRTVRQRQAKDLFYFNQSVPVLSRGVVLVDDICTTGATLSSAAQLLRRSGAETVHAVVCAWQAPPGLKRELRE